MKLKMLIAAVLAPVLLFTACASSETDNNDGDSPAKSDDSSKDDKEDNKEVNVDPSEVVNAVVAEIPITSAFEKDKETMSDYYPGIDVTKVESAAFILCASGAYPDEIAVIKCTDSSAAASAKAALEKRLESQTELYSTYTPDEMYKLDTAVIYTSGNYAIFIALSDNDRAKEIVDGLIV